MAFGKIHCDQIRKEHLRIREHFLLRLPQNLCEGAKKHLHRGLMVRLDMLEEALLILDNEVSKAQEPLNQSLSVRLTLFLNAYYLNLTGSLDNLAWALTYQHNLFDGIINEDKQDCRRFVQLFGKKFLAQLRQKHSNQLSDALEPFCDWHRGVKKFRDPAAHRIPLHVPSSVYSDDDVKQKQSLGEKGAKLIKQGNHDKGMALIRQSHQLGKYMPIFISSEAPEPQPYYLAGCVNFDHQSWLQIVTVVFRYFEKDSNEGAPYRNESAMSPAISQKTACL